MTLFAADRGRLSTAMTIDAVFDQSKQTRSKRRSTPTAAPTRSAARHDRGNFVRYCRFFLSLIARW